MERKKDFHRRFSVWSSSGTHSRMGEGKGGGLFQEARRAGTRSYERKYQPGAVGDGRRISAHHRLRADDSEGNFSRPSYGLGSTRACAGSGQSPDAGGQSAPSQRGQAARGFSTLERGAKDARRFSADSGP